MTRAIRLALAATRDPAGTCSRELVGGVAALVSRARASDAPVVVFANAATSAGIDEPAVARLLRGLAAAGFVGVAPELPRIRDGIITPATVEALVDVARAAGPRVTLLGASTGAGLTILAAADQRLVAQLDAVGAVAPFASLREMLRLGTTGFYLGAPVTAAPLVAEALARSLRFAAPADAGVEPLLANRDPDRFEDLYASLAPSTLSVIAELSPINAVTRVQAPIELLVGTRDAYCPANESRALANAGTHVRLTLTSGLDHVRPRLRPGLFGVACFLERTLRSAGTTDAVNGLRPVVA